MSGTVNPLMPPQGAPQQQGVAPQGAAPAPPNQLMRPAAPPDPLAWQKQAANNVQQMKLTPDQVMQHLDQLSTMVPLMGDLLRKPVITEKDVVKVGASGAQSGLTPVSQIVSQLLEMPEDPAALRQWVQQKYAGGLMAMVQFKTLAQQMGLPLGTADSHLFSEPTGKGAKL